MSWEIVPTIWVQRTLLAWDAALREELQDFTATITDNPMGVLLRSPKACPIPGALVGEYRSAIDPEMEVTLYFVLRDPEERVLQLVMVVRRARGEH